MKKFVLVLCLLATTPSWAKAPIVFIHGIIAFPLLYKQPFSLARVLKRRGYEACVVNNKAVGTIEESVEQAKIDIQECLPEGPFHLVGHSQGGLVSRVLAALPEYRGRILSVTTLSTPHHGSLLANKAFTLLSGEKGYGRWMREVLDRFFSNSLPMTEQFTTTYLREVFNPKYPNQPGVKYFSYGHYIPGPSLVYASVPLIGNMEKWMRLNGEGPNDGFVGTYSCRWGEYLGDFPGDHVSETYPTLNGGKFTVFGVFDRVTKNLDAHF